MTVATDWTNAQKDAINARGMQILVSAAAGSGKTAVLTERVKNILSDMENPCSVSEILVVTFTKAAASEMRERIYIAIQGEINTLEEKFEELIENGIYKNIDAVNEKKAYLKKQLLMLPTADICTMDSFCARVVKENFSKANISYDFKTVDEKELDELTSKAIEKVIDEMYTESGDGFEALVKMVAQEKDDTPLEKIIVDLYKFSLSYPFPKEWVKELNRSFSVDCEPNGTLWANEIYKYVDMLVDFHITCLEKCEAMLIDSGEFKADYVKKFTDSISKLYELKSAVGNKAWDSMVQMIREGLVFKSTSKNTEVNEMTKKVTSSAYSAFSKDFSDLCDKNIPTVSEHRCDNSVLYPIISELCGAVIRLIDLLEEMKYQINTYSFADILHKCIDLLVSPDGDRGMKKSDVCEQLVERYKHILIDEYQDTNDAQNIIFEALSRNEENLYVVGDVKQSIYRFRLSSPAMFMAIRNKLTKYDKSMIKPSYITLDANFRSRKGVDDTINYFFEKIMSEKIGDVEYNEEEHLVFGAKYYPEKTGPDAELLCVDCEGLGSKNLVLREADEIAKYIKHTVEEGVEITVKNKNKTKDDPSDFISRKIRYEDFCILLRVTKDRIDKYVDALKAHGIPTNAIVDGDTSQSKEIRALISLVKAIDNPMLDIPLIATMMSPIFGFSPDELAEIRMINHKSDLYSNLLKFSEQSTKAKHFLNKLDLYRNIAYSYPIDEFVRFLIDDTSIEDIYLAESDGEIRKGNIEGFKKFAVDFCANSGEGLGSFIRYIDYAIENNRFRNSEKSESYNGVKIMTIHKSKGLEFPYVIVAGMSKTFDFRELQKTLVVSRETGVGIKIRDDEKLTKYDTVSSFGTEMALRFSIISEELRMYYVALTRAREHITFLCSYSGKSFADRVMLNGILATDTQGKLHPYAVYRSTSTLEWVFSCFMRHRDCGLIREKYNTELIELDETTFSLDCSSPKPVSVSDVEIDRVSDNESAIDYALLNEIQNKLSKKYEYNCDGILAKRTASSTEKTVVKKEYFANSKPRFLKGDFTGADRGTAIHKFLEKCDFSLAAESVSDEKDRLLSSGIMTEKELSVVDERSISAFLESDVIKRLMSAEKVFKEYEFSILKKAGELYEDASPNVADEEIVVQGKLDCAFVENGQAILIDYKSDNISDESVFVSTYKPQIDIYSCALSECTGLSVKERYIYSFKLNKFIIV